ncbi:type II toxin-antitoxin system VapC family toxin [Halomicrobium urmianum]|uniref:type II toxin-antitoxin system VapC family toxin n=1 Tax=Halomicrobium urmianum TaxID=1586233 RepID=UPI001CD928D7|nr:PIN domain-containing protein [Halomicrobium urmianum]
MTVLVDTGVLYAYHDEDANRHETADAALDIVFDRELGQPFISDYVYDETVTRTLKRTGSTTNALDVGRRLRGAGSLPDVYETLFVTPSVFDDTVDAFETYDDQQISFTDATTVVLAERHDVDTVLSFDDDFDGVVDRTDPKSL